MRTIGFIALLATALAMPTIMADPNAQTGSQTGSYWDQGTFVAVQGGSNFILAGVVGDHDIFFFDASGNFVGFSIACGPEVGGTVPATAVVGEIMPWDHIGGVIPECLLSDNTIPSSQWVYVDGF